MFGSLSRGAEGGADRARPESADRRARAQFRTRVTTRLLIAVVLVVMMASAAASYMLASQLPSTLGHTNSAAANGSVVASDPSTYFPNGYYSQVVNFSLTHDGDAIVVGNVSFLYVTPSNLETRTMAPGGAGNATSAVAVVTADYQCGTSMGQQRFFFAQVLDGGTANAVKLDYCLLLNTAIANGAHQGGVASPWDLWQISTGIAPTVAIHMTGTGESVSLVELCVGK